jgi:hypothetical protein
MKLQSKHIMIPILALFLAVFAAGCSKGQNKDVSISLTALDGADPASSDALFPRFVTKDEATQKKLDKLNKEVDRIQKEYEKRTEKGKVFIVHTYVSDVKKIPQCTILWYEEHSILHDDYNLTTLAYNTVSGEIMMSKEALNSMQIDGITLSTNVARLYESLNLPGILKETEMQGFETDENAAVTAIFMKLIIETPDPADPSKEIEQQHFYYYDLAENSLSSLSDHGYELP